MFVNFIKKNFFMNNSIDADWLACYTFTAGFKKYSISYYSIFICRNQWILTTASPDNGTMEKAATSIPFFCIVAKPFTRSQRK